MADIKGPVTGLWRGLPWYEKEPDLGPSNDCPHCGRPMKLYQRALSCFMAQSLIRLYRLHRGRPQAGKFHVMEITAHRNGGEFAQLRFWGLTQDAENKAGSKRCSGVWSLTDEGASFAERRIRVPINILLGPRARLLGFSGQMVDARESLEASNRFNYEELMGPDYGKGTQLLLDSFMGPKGV